MVHRAQISSRSTPALKLRFWIWILLMGVAFVWSWMVWRNRLLVQWFVWWMQPLVFRGCRDYWRVFSEATKIHFLNILVGVDLVDFFHKNRNEIFCPAPPKASKYSILTVIELALPVLESSTRITYFMPPLLPNAILLKREVKTNHQGEKNWSPWPGNPHSQLLHYLSSSKWES